MSNDAYTSPRLVEIDATGLRCPLPVIRMEAALRRLSPGDQIRITADDPIARVDIPHFCREGGHAVEALQPPSDTAAETTAACVFLVTRR